MFDSTTNEVLIFTSYLQVPNSSRILSGYFAMPLTDQWLRKRFKLKYPALVPSVDYSISKEKLSADALYAVQHQVGCMITGTRGPHEAVCHAVGGVVGSQIVFRYLGI